MVEDTKSVQTALEATEEAMFSKVSLLSLPRGEEGAA